MKVGTDYRQRKTIARYLSEHLIKHQSRSLDDDRDFQAVLDAMVDGVIELIELDRRSRQDQDRPPTQERQT